MNMHKKIIIGSAVLLVLLTSPTALFSHCEIPCGIYDDAMRIQMIDENIRTIEKSMQEIVKLQAAGDINYNQLVRWILNKEHHADQLCETVTEYFMKQRISPIEASDGKAYEAYINKLTLLHKLMVYSMKCKQTTDLENVAKLRENLAAFKSAYFGEGAASQPEQQNHSH